MLDKILKIVLVLGTAAKVYSEIREAQDRKSKARR